MDRRVVIDTNLWLYLLGVDPDPAKKELVVEVLERLTSEGWEVFMCSQVCKEFVRVSLEKYNSDPKLIEENIRKLKGMVNMLYEDCEDVTTAMALRSLYNLQFWDSVIIATALNNKIPYILTEDVSYSRIELRGRSVELINPFSLASPPE
ncbi:PIN domain-containing protein [Hydrogenivirga sp.]